MIGVNAHQPGADRPNDEADREDRRRLQKLRSRVALREERAREIEREGGVDVPVEPFDQIAERSAEDVFQALRRRAGRAQGAAPTSSFSIFRSKKSLPC